MPERRRCGSRTSLHFQRHVWTVAPSALDPVAVTFHALTGVAIDQRPFGPAVFWKTDYGFAIPTAGLRRTDAPSRFARTRTRGFPEGLVFEA